MGYEVFRSHSLGEADRDIVALLQDGLIEDLGEVVASQELGSAKKLAGLVTESSPGFDDICHRSAT